MSIFTRHPAPQHKREIIPHDVVFVSMGTDFGPLVDVSTCYCALSRRHGADEHPDPSPQGGSHRRIEAAR